jgi:hypothetical protein
MSNDLTGLKAANTAYFDSAKAKNTITADQHAVLLNQTADLGWHNTFIADIDVEPTLTSPTHAINFKSEDATPFAALVDKVLPRTLLIVPGGTISQSVVPDESKLSEDQLAGIALIGSDLIYSVNLNNPVETEQARLDELKTTNNVSYLRFGNEDYNNPSSPPAGEPNDAAAFALGQLDGNTYVSKATPFITGLTYGASEVIMVGAFPSNQRSSKFNSYRQGWNDSVIAFSSGKGYLIDFHAYHRSPISPPFDTAMFEDTLDLLGDTRAIICEAGAITGVGNHETEETYVFNAIDVVEKVNAILRPTDIMGAHILNDINNGLGLTSIDGTTLSEYGEAFFNLSKVKSSVVKSSGSDGYINVDTIDPLSVTKIEIYNDILGRSASIERAKGICLEFEDGAVVNYTRTKPLGDLSVETYRGTPSFSSGKVRITIDKSPYLSLSGMVTIEDSQYTSSAPQPFSGGVRTILQNDGLLNSVTIDGDLLWDEDTKQMLRGQSNERIPFMVQTQFVVVPSSSNIEIVLEWDCGFATDDGGLHKNAGYDYAKKVYSAGDIGYINETFLINYGNPCKMFLTGNKAFNVYGCVHTIKIDRGQ